MILFIKQSLKRRMSMHVHVFVILICAFILPFVISFVRDSLVHGHRMQARDHAGNSQYQITGAAPQHIDYYKNIDNFDVSYENGTIYFFATKGYDENKQASYADEIMAITFSIGDGSLVFNDMTALFKDNPQTVALSLQFWVLVLILVMLAMLTMQAAYSIHIGNFYPEISMLQSIGASKKQVKKLFLIELLFLFILAGAVGFFVSYAVVFCVVQFFLKIESAETNLSWVIFHVEPINVLVIFAVMFIFLMGLYALKMRGVARLSPQELALYSKNNQKLRHYRKKLVIKKNAVRSISGILFSRASKGFLYSLLIAVPTVAVFVFVLNYVSINIDDLNREAPYDIFISRWNVPVGETLGFTEEDIDFLNGLEGVDSISYSYNGVTDNYYIEQRGSNDDNLGMIVDGVPFISAMIRPAADIDSRYLSEAVREAVLSNPDGVVMSKNNDMAQYKINETVNLYQYAPKGFITADEHDHTHEHTEEEAIHEIVISMQDMGEPVELKVVALIDTPQNYGLPVIYMADTAYYKLMGEQEYNIAGITLGENTDPMRFTQLLREKMNSAVYQIENLREEAQLLEKSGIGLFVLIGIIALVILAVVVSILYIILSEYMRQQRENMVLFHVLGASYRTIRLFYLRQSVAVSLLGLVLSIGLGALFSNLFFMNSGYHLSANVVSVLMYSVIIVVVTFAINGPILNATRRKNMQKYNII